MYQSPFIVLELLQQPIPESMDKAAVTMLRKMLLAEIDLSATQTIKVGKHELTKNDVLVFIDGLNNSRDTSFHAAIFNDKTLLRFLSEHEIENFAAFAPSELYKDPDFIAFISEYYRNAYQVVLHAALRKQDYRQVQTLHRNPLLIKAEDHYSVRYQTIALLQNAETTLDKLQAQIENGASINAQQLTGFYNLNWIDSLNALPDYYENFRGSYATSLINLAVVVYNRQALAISTEIITNARLLKVNDDRRSVLESYYRQLTTEYTETANEGGWSWWTYAVIGFFILRIIGLVGGCNKSHSSNNYNNYNDYPSQYISPSTNHVIEEMQEENQKKLDSTLNILIKNTSKIKDIKPIDNTNQTLDTKILDTNVDTAVLQKLKTSLPDTLR